MNKGIAVKLVIILVVLGVVHSVFWFFKTGQIEKQVNNFISENSAHVSAGEVSVSGFPLKQKVTIKDLKFTIPNPAFNKYQTTIKHLEATSGIFGNSFSIAILEQALVQDSESSSTNLVEFNKEPEVTASISDGMITKFSYQDFGHRILDTEKNVVYASSSTNITLESYLEEGDKIKTKITANLKDIEGFDILSIYKNSSEKKVIEGIKAGEIIIGNSAAPTPAADTATPAPVVAIPAATPAVDSTSAANANVDATDSAAKPEDMTAALGNNLIKSNFIADIEYTLTPNQAGQQSQTDPTQIQETPVQYSRTVKINNAEFSNPLYKITINGQLDTFQDDALPSGSFTTKVEKIDNLINHIATGLNQIADQKKAAPDVVVQSADLNANNTSPTAATAPVVPAAADAAPVAAPTPVATDDSYQIFLKRFAAGLAAVTKETGSKNQLSKDDVAVFDVRREKNIEFLINETPVREILGKF